MSALVSLVIPAQGELQYFNQTLESIQSSTYRDFEVVIVDDGISNQVAKSIMSLIATRMNYKLVKNEGSGIVDALNTGIKNSNGIYIARIDSDDCLLPERLQIQVDFLASHPLVGVIGSQIIYMDEFGMSKGSSDYPLGCLSVAKGNFRFCPIAHPSVMLKRSDIQRVGNYQSFLRYKGREFAEDYYLWTRLASITEIWNLAKPLTLYRQHKNQVSASNWNVTTLAAELVFLRIYDTENQITLPIILDSIDEKFRRKCVSLGIKKVGLLFGIHLYFRFLLTGNLSKFFYFLLTIVSKFLARILRFMSH